MRRWLGHLTTVALLIGAATAAACGGSDDSGTMARPTATPTAAPTQAPAAPAATSTPSGSGTAVGAEEADAAAKERQATAPPGTVIVVGVEWAFGTGVDSMPAGTVTFEMLNEGAVVHDLWVVRTDLAYDALPVEGGLAVTGGANEVIDKVLETDAGTTISLTVDLAPGSYALICNIPAHYQLGMRAPFTIE